MTDRDEPYTDDERRVMEILRSITAEDRVLTPPPAGLWDRIDAARRAEEAGGRPDAPRGPAGVAVPPPAMPAPTPLHTSPPASPPSILHGRDRARRWFPLLAVAAVVAVAVVGVAALVGDRGDRGRTVASVTLSSDGLPGAPAAARGQAIIRERDGQRVLRLDLEGVSARSGEYLELWLIDTNVKGMVSLGLAENGHDYVLPAGLALGEYPVVDVSTEPYDGDPAHSGSSLVRGLLPV
jgi:hypothetical protein